MEERKLTKEDIDRVRGIEGFPIAKDEDIIALSRPPYYTACPNPFIEDFIREHGTPYDEATDDYHCEPFAADVSDDKYDKIYHFHPYHTKVPYKTISKYINHYTSPGDVILDAFCGSGMTGAALMYLDNEVGCEGRNIILSDLSPAATFISAATLNFIKEHADIVAKLNAILDDVNNEVEWMYQTKHSMKGFNGEDLGVINSVIWSDIFVCPACNKSFVFWDSCVDIEGGKILSQFKCPHCSAQLKKDDCGRYIIETVDDVTGERVQVAQQVPVLINYSFGGRRYDKKPDDYDFGLIDRIERTKIPYWVPTNELPEGDNTSQPQISHGFTRVNQFYTKRNLWALGAILNRLDDSLLGFVITKVAFRITKRYGLTYQSGTWGAGGGPTNGTLYIPSLVKELPVVKQLRTALSNANKVPYLRSESKYLITTQSTTVLSNIPDNSIDYIFTDPPFGGNLNYSELNFIWESWLRVFTNTNPETIINKTQKKALAEYHQLISLCFSEYYRVLKPNHWITVEFHNSSNAIWNAIQESLMSSGFIVADVRVLDKGKMSFKQIVSKGSVKSDLIITAYKPKESFVNQFTEHAAHYLCYIQ
jgi:DNA modification methylase